MVQTMGRQAEEEVVQEVEVPRGWGPPDSPRNRIDHPLPPESMFALSEGGPPNPLQALRSGRLTLEDGLVDVPAEALRPTLLWRLFKSGAKAVRVVNEPMVPQLWQELMPLSPTLQKTALGEVLPWGSTLQSVARNYHPSHCVGQMVGDLFYARPPVLTYMARKMVVYPREGSSDLVLEPGVMHQEGGPFRMPSTIVRALWELGIRLLEGLSAPNWRLAQPAVAFERLMYDASLEDLHQRIELVRNALGPWGQLGHRLDELWAETSRPFRRRILHEVMTLGRLVPGIKGLLHRINQASIDRRPEEFLPEGSVLAGEPHTDNRLFSCLTSRRVGIRTEYFVDGRWRELPVTPDSLVIFPGNLARRALGLEPTLHRILYTGEGESGVNATILIGLSPRGP